MFVYTMRIYNNILTLIHDFSVGIPSFSESKFGLVVFFRCNNDQVAFTIVK